MIEAAWDDVHSSALDIAFLLDLNMNLQDFVGTEEENSMGQTCDHAVDSKLLGRLGATREEFNRELYHFASVKLQWTSDEKIKSAGTNPCDWWMVRRRSFPLLSELADHVSSFPVSSTRDPNSRIGRAFISACTSRRWIPSRAVGKAPSSAQEHEKAASDT